MDDDDDGGGRPSSPRGPTDEWSTRVLNFPPTSIRHWTNSDQDLRALYHELSNELLRDPHDFVRRRFVLTLFPIIVSIYATPSSQKGSLSKAASGRTTSRQLGILAAIIATEDTTKKELDVIKDNLNEWIRAGRRWQNMARKHGSGRLFQISARPPKVDVQMGKSSIPAAYFESVVAQCAKPDKLNRLGKAALRDMAGFLNKQERPTEVGSDKTTTTGYGHKRKHSGRSSGDDDDDNPTLQYKRIQHESHGIETISAEDSYSSNQWNKTQIDSEENTAELDFNIQSQSKPTPPFYDADDHTPTSTINESQFPTHLADGGYQHNEDTIDQPSSPNYSFWLQSPPPILLAPDT